MDLHETGSTRQVLRFLQPGNAIARNSVLYQAANRFALKQWGDDVWIRLVVVGNDAVEARVRCNTGTKHWCGDAQQQQFQKMLLSSAFVIKCEKGVQRISQLFKLSACRNGACVLKKSDAGEDYGKQLQRVIPTKTRKKSVWKAFQAERFKYARTFVSLNVAKHVKRHERTCDDHEAGTSGSRVKVLRPMVARAASKRYTRWNLNTLWLTHTLRDHLAGNNQEHTMR
ncbi:hypothetical protein e1012e08.tmp0031 [Eimeria tenella]|uniref:Uncharacterized protein n=1 Tax=Eimeria tenella TaxID=5802 RepID=C8TDJ8_EIMTE|nr:hypothetical protein e1012e08.tmp0031 [Eimeria tenella]